MRARDFAYSGTIYSHPRVGTYCVHGGIREKYLAMGGTQGALRYPTSDELATPNGADGRYHTFEHGDVFWLAATGGHVVSGAILDNYAALGFVVSDLGSPTSDVNAGRTCDFSCEGSRRAGARQGASPTPSSAD